MSDVWPGQIVKPTPLGSSSGEQWPGTGRRPGQNGTQASLSDKIPQQDPMSGGESFMTGLGDPIAGGRQLVSHMGISPEDPTAVDKMVQEREKGIAARDGSGFMRGLGGVTTTAPLMALGPVGAVAGGAAQGLLEPTTDPNFLGAKTKDAALGAIFSTVPAALGKGAGAVVGATMRPDAATLAGSGVELTPGQAGGAVLRRLEEAAKSIPILGNFVRGAEGRSMESFNKAVVNQALAPLQIQVPANIKSGRELIDFGKTQLDNAYNALTPRLKLTMDQGLVKDLGDILTQMKTAPEAQQKQFDTILQQYVVKHFAGTGPMTPLSGSQLKEMESDLGKLATRYSSPTATAGERHLGESLNDVKNAIRDNLERQNPQLAKELKTINTSYAMFTRAEEAAGRRATSGGVFTPNDLLATIKKQDRTARKGAFARGDALMQVYAETGQRVLPGKLPDSGTIERGLSLTQLPMGLAGLPAAPLWSPGGTAAVRGALTPGPDKALAQSILRRGGLYGGIGGEPILNQVLRQQGGDNAVDSQ